MDSYLDINNNYFGVRHYKVHVTKEKIKPLRFITSVISYAIFIWLLLVGLMLLAYVADIKIRAAKGDTSPPIYNAYVVLTGSMVPEIMPKDVVVTKKREAKDLEVEKEVLKRIDMICRFACQKYTIKQGSIINIKGSNIAYVSPHIITIKENNYLIFNGSDKVFINDYSKCIKLKDMGVHIKNN